MRSTISRRVLPSSIFPPTSLSPSSSSARYPRRTQEPCSSRRSWPYELQRRRLGSCASGYGGWRISERRRRRTAQQYRQQRESIQNEGREDNRKVGVIGWCHCRDVDKYLLLSKLKRKGGNNGKMTRREEEKPHTRLRSAVLPVLELASPLMRLPKFQLLLPAFPLIIPRLPAEDMVGCFVCISQW